MSQTQVQRRPARQESEEPEQQEAVAQDVTESDAAADAAVAEIDEALAAQPEPELTLQDAQRDLQALSRREWKHVYGDKFKRVASCSGEWAEPRH